MERAKKKGFTKRSLPADIKLSVRAAQAKKAEDVVILDLRDISSFTDFFIIMNGNSSRQNVAIFENIEHELRTEKVRPLSVEGKEHGEWILMDYGYFIVHVFSQKARDYYALEKLWSDAPLVKYKNF